MNTDAVSLQKQLNDLKNTPSIAHLPYSHYAIEGEDAMTFLQGQLTLDLAKVSAENCLSAGYCNHKGQLYAVIWLYKKDEKLHFCLHNDIADRVIKRLTMFVLRSDVKFIPLTIKTHAVSPAFFTQSSVDQDNRELMSFLTKNADLITLTNNDKLAYIGHDTHFYYYFGAELEEISPSSALALRASAGVFDVVEPTYEKLLPFQCGIGELGGISYDKGCYVGQEVIAINKYRGKNSKHLALGVLDTLIHQDNYAMGTMLRCDEDKPLGLLVDMRVTESHSYILVVMNDRHKNERVQIAGKTTVFTQIFS